MILKGIIELSRRILYLAGDGNYTHVYFVDAPKQLYAKTLAYFALHLPTFVRIHKSYLVNPDYVVGYQTDSNRGATLQVGNEWLRVSKRKIKIVAPLFKPKGPKKGEWQYVRSRE